MKKVLLVGVGLIGGSFSLALRDDKNFVFGGFSLTEATSNEAKDLGIISKVFLDLKEGLFWADWVIIAVPVDAIKKMLSGILDEFQDHQLVVDFGSTKSAICASVANHPRRGQFLAAHPIAGTEYSGPSAAFPDLYREKRLILCEVEKVKSKDFKLFEETCLKIGFEITTMGAEEHDRHLAYISHLSHITSFALSSAVLDKEKDGEVILELSGSGFDSTVRLAKSSPQMWSPIFVENKKMVLEGIDSYLEKIEHLKKLISEEDTDGIQSFLESARKIKKILK